MKIEREEDALEEVLRRFEEDDETDKDDNENEHLDHQPDGEDYDAGWLLKMLILKKYQRCI